MAWGRGYIILAISYTHVAFVNQSTEERTLKILLENKSVKVLNLYDDSIGVEGTQSLVTQAVIHR